MSLSFLDDLFGDDEGVVYSPVKLNNVPKEKAWKKHFFDWPKDREKLEGHINGYNQYEVYLSPVLFSDRRIAPDTFKGTRYLWTEFDGTTPTDYIEPSIRVSSSIEGHEHWYWRLDKFETDKVLVEDLNRRIAYKYGADLSAWDYQQVLRPVDTWNHKRNKPVSLASRNELKYSTDSFLD